MAEIVAIRGAQESALDKTGPVTIVRQGGPDSGIARLVLDNPPANALSLATIAALQEALDACAADDSVRVVVLADRKSVV